MLEYATYLMSLPTSEFRAIKRAIRVLIRAGVEPEKALQIICDAHMQRASHRYPRTVAR